MSKRRIVFLRLRCRVHDAPVCGPDWQAAYHFGGGLPISDESPKGTLNGNLLKALQINCRLGSLVWRTEDTLPPERCRSRRPDNGPAEAGTGHRNQAVGSASRAPAPRAASSGGQAGGASWEVARPPARAAFARGGTNRTPPAAVAPRVVIARSVGHAAHEGLLSLRLKTLKRKTIDS